MSNNTKNFVLEVFTAMDALSRIQSGMTLKQLNDIMPYCTRGEVRRVADMLVSMTYAYRELKPHGKTGVYVYHLAEIAAIHCAAIARQYTEQN